MREKRRRYEHWLYKTGRGSWPPALMALSVDVEWCQSAPQSHVNVASLTRWTAALVVRSKVTYRIVSESGGTTAGTFWDTIRLILTRNKSLWVLSYNTKVALATLEVWNGIEEKTLCTVGENTHGNAGRESPLRDMPRDGAAGTLGRVEQVGPDSVREVRRVVDEHDGSSNSGKVKRRQRRSGIMILNDPPIAIQLQLQGQKGKITWVDAANYGVSLPSVEAGATTPARDLATWFIRAASTLHSLGPCGWCMTAGAQAMHIYRSVYLDTPILSHTHRAAGSLEQSGYFGGRCEALQLGRIAGPIYCYDFASMYPYIYTVCVLPTRLERVQNECSVASLVGDGSGIYTIAEVDIETDQPWYPWRDANAIRFPVGRFRTTLCGPELHLAVRNGHVHRVRCAAIYASAPCLASYARDLYALRTAAKANGDKLSANWLKRILVCLYGKFAQRDRQWTTRRGADAPAMWAEWYRELPGLGMCKWRSIGGIVQVETEGEYVSGAVPAIAAAVSSAARMRLLQAMLCAGMDNVYYCDTDSIVTNDAGREALVQHGWVRDGELGYLQLEVTADHAEIYGQKMYQIGTKWRYAGSPGGGDAYWSAAGPEPWMPMLSWSLGHKQRPEAMQVHRVAARKPGQNDTTREPGGRVKPYAVWEW